MDPRLHGYMHQYNNDTLTLHQKLLAIWHSDSQEQAIAAATALLRDTDEALFDSLGWMSKNRFAQLVDLWKKKNPKAVFKIDGEFDDNKALERVVAQAELIKKLYPEAEFTFIFDQGNPDYEMAIDHRHRVVADLGAKLSAAGLNFRLIEGQPDKDTLKNEAYHPSEEVVKALNSADLIVETSASVAAFKMWLNHKYNREHRALKYDYGAANDQWLYQSYIAPHYIESLWDGDYRKMEGFFASLLEEKVEQEHEMKASAEHLSNYDYSQLLLKIEANDLVSYQRDMKLLLRQAYDLEFGRLVKEKMRASTKDKVVNEEEKTKLATRAEEEARKEAPGATVTRLAIEIRDKMYRDTQQLPGVYQNFPIERAVKGEVKGNNKKIMLNGREVDPIVMHSITPLAYPLLYAANGAAFEGPKGADYRAYAQATISVRDKQVDKLIEFILHENNYTMFKETLQKSQPEAHAALQAYESCYKVGEEKDNNEAAKKVLSEFLVNYVKFKPELTSFICRELMDRKYKAPLDSKKRPFKPQRVLDIYEKTAVFPRSQGLISDQQPVEGALESLRISRVPYMSSILQEQGYRGKVLGGYPLYETADASHPASVMHVRPNAEIDMEKFALRTTILALRDMVAHQHLPTSSSVYRAAHELGILEAGIEVDELINNSNFRKQFWAISDQFCKFSIYLGMQNYLLVLKKYSDQHQEKIRDIESTLDGIGEHSDANLLHLLMEPAGKKLRAAFGLDTMAEVMTVYFDSKLFNEDRIAQIVIAYDNDRIEDKIRELITRFRKSPELRGALLKANRIESELDRLLQVRMDNKPLNLEEGLKDSANPLYRALNEPLNSPGVMRQSRQPEDEGFISSTLRAVQTFISEELHQQKQEQQFEYKF